MKEMRNIAVIAHVDHGKTTLVDAFIRQTKTKLNKDQSGSALIMDNNDLERERGITIFSKNASVEWDGMKINIVDTPGHADFGGEVERVLKMVEGCLLLVDAKEGPMPQTKFVLKQALNMGLKVIVVVNKIDKPDARIDFAIGKTFDLFVDLGADEETALFPIVYASGRDGLSGDEPDLSKMTDIFPIFEAIKKYIPAPKVDATLPLKVWVTSTILDNYKGRMGIAKIMQGQLKAGQDVIWINRDGKKSTQKITFLGNYEGLELIECPVAEAGEIVCFAGIADLNIGETLTDSPDTPAFELMDIEKPTVKMTFRVNSSPFAGQEGKFKTARQIQERLFKAGEEDVALKVTSDPSSGVEVSGRGELHLGILIERLRREGYEFEVSRPRVIEEVVNGKTLTPYELVSIEVGEEYSGTVLSKLGLRKGELLDMHNYNGTITMTWRVATKMLFGFRSEFIMDTRGSGIMSSVFESYGECSFPSFQREVGSLVSHATGKATLYSLVGAQERGIIFIDPSTQVYEGQVIGQNSRPLDIRVNVCKEKQQTNHRSSGDGVAEHFNAPKRMNLEDSLSYINDDEMVEITPVSVRIRKENLRG